MKVLITGFGPFQSITDNPSGRLARALDGASGPGFHVVGLEIPTSYARGVELTVQAARAHGVDLVLGTGVAARRPEPLLERFGRRALIADADVDGVRAPELPGPAEVVASLDLVAWAEALGVGLSDDAGGYVCNGWLHQIVQRLAPVPVGFLHVPAHGFDPARVTAALNLLTDEDPARRTRRPPVG